MDGTAGWLWVCDHRRSESDTLVTLVRGGGAVVTQRYCADCGGSVYRLLRGGPW